MDIQPFRRQKCANEREPRKKDGGLQRPAFTQDSAHSRTVPRPVLVKPTSSGQPPSKTGRWHRDGGHVFPCLEPNNKSCDISDNDLIFSGRRCPVFLSLSLSLGFRPRGFGSEECESVYSLGAHVSISVVRRPASVLRCYAHQSSGFCAPHLRSETGRL